MALYGERRFVTTYDRVLKVVVDRERAAMGRGMSCSHVRARLCGEAWHSKGCGGAPAVCSFYGIRYPLLTPIHPIEPASEKGLTHDRGRSGDPGALAIGSPEEGTKPSTRIGQPRRFPASVEAAAGYGIELALDIAFQCAPDHPYVAEHPEWFRKRPMDDPVCRKSPQKISGHLPV